ncbi:MAG: hypothetical protein HYY96_17430 [Candidatus Tectomicrobia bacterium]|nr:hypothetical protein [Candidatus Tectomicrobia bacterium]
MFTTRSRGQRALQGGLACLCLAALLVAAVPAGVLAQDFSEATFEFIPGGIRINNITVAGQPDHYWADFAFVLPAGRFEFTGNFGIYYGAFSPQTEACRVCHGPNHEFAVATVHLPPQLDAVLFPGVNVEITNVGGASGSDGTFQVGDRPAVTYTVKNNAGQAVPVTSLSSLNLLMSGPASNYQRVLAVENTVRQGSTQNADGSWTYTFTNAIPATYLAPLNDSTALGPENGELTGEALLPGTYSIGMYGGAQQTIKGEVVREAGNAVVDVLFGGATELQPRRVIAQENCNRCHNDLQLHGGLRKSVRLCVLCHAAGAEDRINTDPAKQTPGRTIEFKSMIHKIHYGAELHEKPLQIIGFGDSVHDFSNVEFPYMPGGVRNCEVCHAGNEWKENPSRKACGACHDDVNFASGENHPGGPQANDSACATCHPPDTGGLAAIAAVHLPPQKNPALFAGVNVELLAVGGGSGAEGVFQVGDRPTVTFTIKDNSGADIAPASLRALRGMFSGPTGNYQRVIAEHQFDLATVVSGADGALTYAFPAIPATYLPPNNDSLAFGPRAGERTGQPLEPGTYTVAFYAQVNIGDTGEREADPVTQDVRFGTPGPLVARAAVNTDNCNRCHGDLALHGRLRKTTNVCVMCHTGGAEDRINADPEKATPGETTDFRRMIHRIHYGAEVNDPPIIIGFGDSVHDFSKVEFPWMPGGVRNCTACHGASLAYTEPSRRACTSCHDSTSVAAHVETMTADQ